ncbi:tRNA ligase [Microthyrium microscopicum]|uniref:tRNA ligase n=1 Tax=Microthyrium microscopicum TaxID=703497 RepID=A0A6A6U6Y8_9PEZI|nr:tRNA ligase [Microthyrium microscopicum]
MSFEERAAPYAPQDPAEIARMVSSLEASTKKGQSKTKSNLSVRKATFILSNGRTVDSWRMQDWDYKKDNLVTYARGLFTRKNEKSNQQEIVVRGYDKFFNHGEVRNTEWENVKRNTRGPYELSVKENGCIIFIGALDDETLLVCSKHSTGARGDMEKSHAVVGERWLEKHLKSVGKSKADLAKELRCLNATAVAELCDDEFEEHVLAYTPDVAGLYLHGVNLNLPEFATYPHNLVDQFAETWGFRKVTHIVEQDIDTVKKFLDDIANTGAYEGRDTEGFVIRCQSRDGPKGEWHDWFFKYKFEEPYLMYRQWRECTKSIISGKQPRYKKHKKITEEYLLFARKQLASNSKLAKEYNQNHGIIKLRDDFLKFKGLTGADVIQSEIESGESNEVTNDVLLVPIATLGCGKTTIGIALQKLFEWGVFQNDNVTGKARRPERFVSQCTMELAAHPVVFADRNNHQKRERAQFIHDVQRIVPRATFVALHWVHNDNNREEVRQRLRARVLNRGDNHQTIHPETMGKQEVIGIMDGFLSRFQSLDPESPPDCDFDTIIDLDPLVDSRENLELIISRLSDEYPKLFPSDLPTASDLDDAIAFAMSGYKPETKHQLGFNNDKQKNKRGAKENNDRSVQSQKPKKKDVRPPKLEYLSVRVEPARIQAILDAVFKELPAEQSKFYYQLSKSRRLQAEFHVTLMHRTHATTHGDKWKQMSALWDKARASDADVLEPTLGNCRVLLERVVWDPRVMAFVVRLVNDEKDEQWESVNRIAHITCGTASESIKPRESNDLLARWLEGGKAAEGILDAKVKGHVVLDGVVKGVPQKL